MQAITRPWSYAIVDEVDSVLIDECRNPMIMSLTDAVSEESVERYRVAAQVSPPGSCASTLPRDGAWGQQDRGTASWLLLNDQHGAPPAAAP